jgi:hypothetical protein
LGAGATGRVIRFCSNPRVVGRREYYALKVVLAENELLFHRELDTISNYSLSKCTCSLFPVMISTRIAEENGLAAMLLSPVGVARKAKVGIRASQKMVQLLSELHRHDPPYCHGDSRIQNIITDGDSLRFIDFAFGLIVIQQNGAKINSPKIC